ncbi:hypothetical protein DE146DRAFT_660113 [Phaeosphaeria sp. MPI-PUGE-AT-0046c]|nr:hypothetical protein DE146DRAFT_660113 [Phaeosphaeria sp. MPI-PUGE-AT-0046c]
MESFLESCEDYKNYPNNHIPQNALSHTLQAYHDRLDSRKNDLFDERKAAVDFWDLSRGSEDYYATCVNDLDSMKENLRKALLPQSSDPGCRYIFLNAPHSRARLRVSAAMFKLLFSYHQIMPSFLDFVFPFGKQVYPQDVHFSGLREDSRLGPHNQNNGLMKLGRSGSGFQLCYNLRSVEPSKDQSSLPWSIRQAAVYHQFDTNTATAVWVIVKGNKLIEKRIMEATQQPASARQSTRSEAFSAALSSHLLMCDWSGENWRWYINDLENKFQALTRGVITTQLGNEPGPSSPVSSYGFSMSPRSPTLSSIPFSLASTSCNSPLRPANSFPTTTRSSTLTPDGKSQCPAAKVVSFSSTGAGNHVGIQPHGRGIDSTGPYDLSRIQEVVSQSLTKIKSWRQPHGLGRAKNHHLDLVNDSPTSDEKWGPQEHPPEILEQDSGEPPEEFTFRDLQRIQYIEEKAQETHLVLGMNILVLQDLRQHYRNVTEHPNFPAELKNGCEGQLSRFDRCVLGVEKDLHMLQARTQNLLDRLSNRKNLLNGLLQHRSVKTSAEFAKKAQQSADHMETMTIEMHEIAKKTKQETVSMRVITTVTLFFLPATFIATFMSTDILKFEHDQQDFQIKGLRTYLAIALPLTVLTFAAWYVIYCLAKRSGLDYLSRRGRFTHRI